MIEFGDDGLSDVAERDEVDDVEILIESADRLNRHSPVVSVQPLANISVERDEMCCAEDQMVFGDADAVLLGHGNRQIGGHNRNQVDGVLFYGDRRPKDSPIPTDRPSFVIGDTAIPNERKMKIEQIFAKP